MTTIPEKEEGDIEVEVFGMFSQCPDGHHHYAIRIVVNGVTRGILQCPDAFETEDEAKRHMIESARKLHESALEEYGADTVHVVNDDMGVIQGPQMVH